MIEAKEGPKDFWRNRGHDHFLIFSLTEFTMTGISIKEFMKGVCQNCSVLTVESTPTKTSTLYHRSRKFWWVFLDWLKALPFLLANACTYMQTNNPMVSMI
jgi:hypothetical protein